VATVVHRTGEQAVTAKAAAMEVAMGGAVEGATWVVALPAATAVVVARRRVAVMRADPVGARGGAMQASVAEHPLRMQPVQQSWWRNATV
jgi:hypothetical protein